MNFVLSSVDLILFFFILHFFWKIYSIKWGMVCRTTPHPSNHPPADFDAFVATCSSRINVLTAQAFRVRCRHAPMRFLRIPN